MLYVDEGSVLTSAGSAAGLDLCLHIVRSDHGTEVANNVARRLVLAPHREGGQRQFIESPVTCRGSSGSLEKLDWLSSHIEDDLNVADLARFAGMSMRSFQRRFRATTGLTPSAWLIRQRVEHARRLTETTALTVEEVATSSGFRTVETFRYHFRRPAGTTPTDYRRTFGRSSQNMRVR